MNQNVQKLVINRFLNLYGAPNVDNPKGFVDEYHKALGGYTEAVIEKAMDAVIAEHAYQSWPVVGLCVQRCKEQIPVVTKAYPDYREEASWPAPTPDQKARVRELVSKFKASLLINHEDQGDKRPRVDRDSWRARFGDGE